MKRILTFFITFAFSFITVFTYTSIFLLNNKTFAETQGQVHTGKMTYYGNEVSSDIKDSIYVGGSGGYTLPELNEYISHGVSYFVAMNHKDLLDSQLMGGFVEITEPSSGKKENFLIIDTLPSREDGIDINTKTAFGRLKDPTVGFFQASWKIIPLPYDGTMTYTFEGTGKEWSSIRILHNNYPIQKLEYKNSSGSWVEIPRETNGSARFISTSTMGNTTDFDIQITSIFGEKVQDKIDFSTPKMTGKVQFGGTLQPSQAPRRLTSTTEKPPPPIIPPNSTAGASNPDTLPTPSTRSTPAITTITPLPSPIDTQITHGPSLHIKNNIRLVNNSSSETLIATISNIIRIINSLLSRFIT